MCISKKIRVLIVDDSLIFREVIAKGISSDPIIEVVAKVTHPFNLKNKLRQYHPEVIVSDVAIPHCSIPVIVVSPISQVVFEAMNTSKFDFVPKPDIQVVAEVEAFINELIDKIKIVASMPDALKSDISSLRKIVSEKSFGSNRLIAIGASTGGTEAIQKILKELPQNCPGIVIVQHIPAGFSRMFAERLNNTTKLQVKEARTGDLVEPGRVLIAPGDQHLRVKKNGTKFTVECFQGERINGHCPSVDVLFESVANEAGKHSLGIILTGMGYDGAKGLLTMRRKGAKTIGQDEKSSVVYGMPKVAFEIGAVEIQAAIEDIPHVIFSMLK